MDSGYFSLEKTKPDPPQPPQHPHHLPLPTPEGPCRYTSSDSGSFYSNCTSPVSASLPSPDSELSALTPPITMAPPTTLTPPTILTPPMTLTPPTPMPLTPPIILTPPMALTPPTIVTTPPGCEDKGGACVGGPWGRGGPGSRSYAALADVPKAKRLSQRQAFSAQRQRLQQRARSPGREEVARLFGLERR